VDCEITDEGCAALASALRSNPSHMKEMDMTKNNLTDMGTNLLTAIKFNPHYKLKYSEFELFFFVVVVVFCFLNAIK